MRSLIVIMLILLAGCASSPTAPAFKGLDVLQKDGTLEPFDPSKHRKSGALPQKLLEFSEQHKDRMTYHCNEEQKTCVMTVCVGDLSDQDTILHQSKVLTEGGWFLDVFLALCPEVDNSDHRIKRNV